MMTTRPGLFSGEAEANPYQRWQIVGGLLIAFAILAKLLAFAMVLRLKIGIVDPQDLIALLHVAFAVATLGLAIGLTASFLEWRRRHRR